ncbi:hypothetical protein V8G54_022678, partial [Vigna mungo]
YSDIIYLGLLRIDIKQVYCLGCCSKPSSISSQNNILLIERYNSFCPATSTHPLKSNIPKSILVIYCLDSLLANVIGSFCLSSLRTDVEQVYCLYCCSEPRQYVLSESDIF